MKDAALAGQLDVRPEDNAGRVGWVAAAGWGVYAVRHLLGDRPIGAVIDALAMAVCVLGAMGWPRTPGLRVHTPLVGSWLGLVALSTVSGQAEAPTVWWLVCIPLAASYLTDRRWTLVWTGLSMAAAIGLFLAGRYAPVAPEFVPVGVDRLASQLVLISIVVSISLSVRSGADATLASAVAARRSALELAERLEESNGELDAARVAAERDAAARGAFAAAVSHEIRTPLNGIMGMAQLLQDEREPSRVHEYSQELLHSSATLLRLVNNVLNYSKSREGKLVFASDAFALEEVIEDALQLYAAQSWAADIDLAHIPGENVPDRATGDGGAIQQVVANLVGNALRYTHTGTVVVRTRLVDWEHVAVEVEDTGVGIDPARLATIWDPWVRGEADRVGGTGLGLALVKGLVESLGGTVAVVSALGVGSTFTVVVPLDLSSTMVPEDDTLPRTLLLAVDRDATGAAIVARCRRWGVKTTWVGSPSALVSALGDSAFDALICQASWLPDVPAGAPPVVVFQPRPDEVSQSGLGNAITTPVRSDVLRSSLVAVMDPTGEDTLPSVVFDASLGRRKPLDILVVEDNPTNQRLLVLMLDRLSYRPIVVGDGLAAVEAVRKRRFDLVLMDRSMPEMDGIAASKILYDLQPDIRIVLVSAGYDEDQYKQCLAIGVRDFLDKPVHVTALRLLLEDQGGRRASSTTSPLRSANRAKDAMAALRVLCGGDTGELERLVAIWEKSTRDQLQRIRSGVAGGQLPEVVRAAHSMKGASGTYGANQLVELARVVESQAGDGATEPSVLMGSIASLEAGAAEAMRLVRAEL